MLFGGKLERNLFTLPKIEQKFRFSNQVLALAASKYEFEYAYFMALFSSDPRNMYRWRISFQKLDALKGLTDCLCDGTTAMAVINDPETVQKGKFQALKPFEQKLLLGSTVPSLLVSEDQTQKCILKVHQRVCAYFSKLPHIYHNNRVLPSTHNRWQHLLFPKTHTKPQTTLIWGQNTSTHCTSVIRNFSVSNLDRCKNYLHFALELMGRAWDNPTWRYFLTAKEMRDFYTSIQESNIPFPFILNYCSGSSQTLQTCKNHFKPSQTLETHFKPR